MLAEGVSTPSGWPAVSFPVPAESGLPVAPAGNALLRVCIGGASAL